MFVAAEQEYEHVGETAGIAERADGSDASLSQAQGVYLA